MAKKYTYSASDVAMKPSNTDSKVSETPVTSSSSTKIWRNLGIALAILAGIVIVVIIILAATGVFDKNNDSSSVPTSSPLSVPISSPSSTSSPSNSSSPSANALKLCTESRNKGTTSCNTQTTKSSCESRYEYVEGVKGETGNTHLCRWEEGKCNNKGDACSLITSPASTLPICSTMSKIVGGTEKCSKFNDNRDKCVKRYKYVGGKKGSTGSTRRCNWESNSCVAKGTECTVPEN